MLTQTCSHQLVVDVILVSIKYGFVMVQTIEADPDDIGNRYEE